MTSPTNNRFRVRILDQFGERHIVIAYGANEREARIRGQKMAERLLKEQRPEVLWVKEWPYGLD